MLAIIIFFLSHWFLSLFFHSFFLHRYASHRLYTTTRGWERFFYLSTWFVLGSSFLVPRAYAVLHRMHHTYSDTEKDPHSPHFFKDVWQMMFHTAAIFRGFVRGTNIPEEQFTREYLPQWDRVDKIGHHIAGRLIFGALYTAFYVHFAPNPWWYLLLPINFLMGPIQGAVVNWCGHKYGYRNFDNGDHSKNSSPFGVILMGELFQNNHHHNKYDPNFARKWFEFDTTYLVMILFNKLGMIKLLPVPLPGKHEINVQDTSLPKAQIS
ncbi:acyl-CoA desaturase [Segetibacter sp. 3557_3]|uniref:fatty acid desaturase n=1 Tax=Segetibacter sp. 3557_3 TaxID=2547429 RepID=UPI001058DE31|nr:fatty acid desaturase [Segetibacter sp. 3557_3]TDH27242.1 acyl-CoA desaturase [Segetibacter sp. 3557_3]